MLLQHFFIKFTECYCLHVDDGKTIFQSCPDQDICII